MSYSQIRGRHRREEILVFLRHEQDQGHLSPTVREIATAVGCSVATAYQHLRVLEATGAVLVTPHLARSIKLA